MKYQHIAVLAIGLSLCIFASKSAFAAPPELGTFQVSLVNSTVTLGEPLIVQYKLTNAESQRVTVGIDTVVSDNWLTMKLFDSLGHSVQAAPRLAQRTRHHFSRGVALDSKSSYAGFLVPSQTFQITQPGVYHLNVSAHLVYSRDDDSGEQSEDDQNFSLPITVTAKNSQQLSTVAESLRQIVLHEKDSVKWQAAITALFSIHDPECLSVWRKLAIDPALDPWRTKEVMDQLVNVNSIEGCNLLAEMQSIAPDRWSQTGTAPLDVLAHMWFSATPELKKHINQLMVKAGEPPVTAQTKLVGTVN